VKFLRIGKKAHSGHGGNSFPFEGWVVQWGDAHKLRHWDPVLNRSDGLSIIVHGRPLVPHHAWSEFKGQPSLVSNYILDLYKSGKQKDWPGSLSGAFTIIILDANSRQIIVVTDIAGVYPLYARWPGDPSDLEVATHPDLIHRQKSTKLDMVSVAEFLSTGVISFPNTYWRDVKALSHATIHIWDVARGEYDSTQYFSIKHQDEEVKKGQIEESLKDAISHAVKIRSRAEFGRTAVLLSGGLDSRMIAAQMGPGSAAITLFDRENREYDLVKALASALDLDHLFVKRGDDYYSDTLKISPNVVGGTSAFINDHFSLALHRNPELFEKLDTILSGCYADWLFKGIAHNRRRTRVIGRILPKYKFEPFSPNFFGASSPLAGGFGKMVEERLRDFYSGIDLEDRNEIEVKRLFPLHQEETSATRLALQRLFEWDPPFVDQEVLKAYMAIPWQMKSDTRYFEKVCSLVAPETIEIPNASSQKKLDESNLGFFSKQVTKRIGSKLLHRLTGKDVQSTVFGEGSWINFPLYMQTSVSIALEWERVSQESRIIVCEVLGRDLWTLSMNQISEIDYHLFYNALTFSRWFETNFRTAPDSSLDP
jgi:asparagine synthase (glutamine-hydrolysing)